MILSMCLATAIFFEARDQPIDGQIAVAEVILNRVDRDQWPNTICGVVNQHKQFSFTHDGQSDDPTKYTNHADVVAWELAQEIASGVLLGTLELGLTSDHYHATSASPDWMNVLNRDGQIGDHIFYTR